MDEDMQIGSKRSGSTNPKDWMLFVGVISTDDLALMSAAIEEAREDVRDSEETMSQSVRHTRSKRQPK
jgi:hypothetical protein